MYKRQLKDLAKLLSVNSKEQEELMTTIAQAIGQEYMQQGMHTRGLEIAKNMLSKLHMHIKDVQAATGLSIEELMKLQEESKS